MTAGQQTPTITITAYADATTDITADVEYPADAEWGINGNDINDHIASTGSHNFLLDNHTLVGKYVPGHSNCMAGWNKGVKIVVEFEYDGHVNSKNWYLYDWEIVGVLEEKVKILCVDWMDKTATHPVINPDLLENATADQALSELLDAFASPPASTEFDTGTNIFPTLLDTVNRFTKAMKTFTDTVLSEFGYLYLRDQENLRFENMLSRNGTRELTVIPVHSDIAGVLQDENSNTITDENNNPIYVGDVEDAEFIYADGTIIKYESESGKSIINRLSATAHPRRIDTEQVLLFQTQTPLYLSSGETRIFREFFTDPVSQKSINAIPPDEEGDIKFLSHFEGSIGRKRSLSDELGRSINCFDIELVDDVFGTTPKFGDTCLYLDGTDSYLTIPFSQYWELTTSNFMFDWWEYRFNTTTAKTTFSRDGTLAVPPFRFGRSNGTSLLVDISSDGASFDIANGKDLGTITTGQFVHYRIVRMGSNFYTFKNGGLEDSWTSASSIFASTAPLYIGRNQSTYLDCTLDEIMIRIGGSYPTEAFTPPTSPYELQGTFLVANTAADQSGNDISDDIDFSADYGTEGATYTLENTGSNNAYITLKTYGYGIHLDSPTEIEEEVADSINSIGVYGKSLDLLNQQDNYIGKLLIQKLIEEERESRIVLNRIYMSANKSREDMMKFIFTDIGDLIYSTVDTIEKDAWFWVQRKGYDIKPGHLIDWWLDLKEHYSLQKGLDDLAVEFGGGANTDCITFPYMPYICGDEVTAFTISAWVYLDTEPTSNSYFIAGPYMDGAGSGLFIGTTDRKVQFYTTRFNVSPGQWSTPADPFSLTTWAHIILKYQIGVNNDPVIKVNNSTQTLTEDSTPAGTLTSAKGANFFVGNVKTPALNYSRCFDGKIKDVRFYPFITTDAQDTIIYNSGTHNPLVGNDNQVFQAFAVKSSRYTAYQNLTLSATTRLIDAHFGVAGTPNGSPIARVP